MVLAAGLAVLVRVPRVGALAYPDEGGALLVVRQWQTEGPGLYGPLEVDRPPLLMAFWRVAAALGGVEQARWLVCPLVATLVLGAGWAGWLIGDARGARWSAITVASLAASPLIGTWEVNAELVAAPLIMLSCALILLSLDRARHQESYRRWALLGGLIGSGAVLVKQNLLDSLVFAAVLLVASTARGTLARADAARLGGWLLAGVMLPQSAAATWVTVWGPGLGALWEALYGFRSAAFQVVMTQSFAYPWERLQLLGLLSVGSGVVVLAGVYLGVQRRSGRRAEPLSIAVSAMLVFGLLSVGLGASYWGHYLIELIPALGLAAGHLCLTSVSTRRWAAVTVWFVALSAVTANAVASTGTLVPSAKPTRPWSRGCARRPSTPTRWWWPMGIPT
ncbi:hypothetical protein BH18ACT8_BH18ACT8_11550 [soil metagenome]